MNAHKSFVVVAVLMIVALFAAACSPAATPAALVIQHEASGAQQAAPVEVTAAPRATSAPAAPAAAPVADKAGASGVNASPFSNTRMIIKNGEMNLMVVDTDRAVDQVTNVAVSVGGYVVSSRTWTQDTFKYASITMGVPVDQFEAAQRQLRALAVEVLSDTASGQDVSDEYVDLQSQLTNLEATAARIRDFLKQATKVDEALAVNAKLTEIEGQIEQVKGRMNYLNARSAFSTIAVNLEPQRPTPTPTATPTATPTPTPVYWQPEKTLNAAADTLGEMLRTLGDLVIWLGVVILPLAVPVLIIYFIIARARRKTKKSEK